MTEYEWEELADMAVEELREFIDTENQCIIEEHKLEDLVIGWDYIIGHLDERIPHKAKNMHKINADIGGMLYDIKDLLKKGQVRGLKFEKEEEGLLHELQEDVKHRDWKAVKYVLKIVKEMEEHVGRLQIHELKDLHAKFRQLMKIMNESKHILAIEEDLFAPLEKEQFAKLEQYYFTGIYKFIGSYERIFRDLWRKENILLKKLEKIS